MKRALTIIIVLLHLINIYSQTFGEYFTENTLRLDYVFAGSATRQDIYLDCMSMSKGWYGKHHNLSSVPMAGNGQIIVSPLHSDEVIYRNSFSTLFQEWLTYDEAKTTQRSFENVFLIPMPKDTVLVTVTLFNNRRETMATMTHQVVPGDILIRKATGQSMPYETLQKADDFHNSIKIAFVAEGYTEEEMPNFINDCNTAIDAIFKHEPFLSNMQKFNIVAVKSASAESGTSEPSKGQWKNTALSSHFDTFYSDRYLTTLHLKDLHDVLSGIPYEHIIVLVNTANYGGGGILNSYNLSMTRHRSFRPVVVHEFGHSFAGLADEYAYEEEALPMYPHDIEPWEQNITTMVDFASKWEDMKQKGEVGLYEGAGYSLKGIYRPTPDCRMRSNENPEFCPVCRRSLQRVIDFYCKVSD